MNNTEEILKRILLNMKYDSRKTLSENKEITLLEQPTKDNQLYIPPTQYNTIPGVTDVLPQLPDVSQTQLYQKLKSEKEYDDTNKISYQTVVPNEYLTIPQSENDKTISPIEWHDSKKPYNEVAAKSLFGPKCLTLSGQEEKYKPGSRPDVDYFIDDNGNKCEPLDEMKKYGLDLKGNYMVKNRQDFLAMGAITPGNPGSVRIKSDTMVNYDYQKKIVYFDVYYESDGKESKSNLDGVFSCNVPDRIYVGKQSYTQTPTDTKFTDILAKKYCRTNGTKKEMINYTNLIKKSGTYTPGCKPIPFDLCLKWSWTSLHEFGGVDKGLKKFKHQKSKDETPIIYTACIKNTWFPWESSYEGFYDESKIKLNYNEAIKQNVGGFCPKGAKTKLSSIPMFKIGSNYNVNTMTRQNDENSDEIATKLTSNFTKQSGENLSDEEKEGLTKIQNTIKGGIRIKGS